MFYILLFIVKGVIIIWVLEKVLDRLMNGAKETEYNDTMKMYSDMMERGDYSAVTDTGLIDAVLAWRKANK